MKLASRVESVPPSVTLAVTSRAKAMQAEGLDVVSFGAGEPDFDTPAYICRAGVEAIEGGQTRYTPASGTVALKAAIARKLERDNGLAYEPDQIIVCCGAKHALYNLFQVLCEPGDECLIPAPYWVSYPQMARLAGAVPVTPGALRERGFKLPPEAFESAITPRTRVVVLNSPSNPTGAVYSEKELRALAEVFLAHEGLWVVSDEIYEKLVYGETRHVSIASVSPEMKARTLVVNGHSKSYAMTGWRLGYAAGDRDVIAAAARLQSHSTSNPASMCQAAGVAALEGGEDEVAAMRAEFGKRRDRIVELLGAIDGVECPRPAGAFYVFPDVSAHYGRTIRGTEVTGSVSFAQAALDLAHVALVPGAGFGADACVRLSYATSMERIEEGARRLARLLAR
jgi:aspartate aminotransferase